MKKTIKVYIIEKFMKDNNLTKTKFCKMCGISVYILNKILADKLNFKSSEFYKVMKTMSMNSYQLLNY